MADDAVCAEAMGALPKDLALLALAYTLPAPKSSAARGTPRRAREAAVAALLPAPLWVLVLYYEGTLPERHQCGRFAMCDGGGPGDLFADACRDGELTFARWLVEHCSTLTLGAGFLPLAMEGACGGGHRAVAEWLVERARCEADGVELRLVQRALPAACSGGQLATARWLVGRLEAAAGARALRTGEEGVVSLGEACRNGHLAVALWLVERFGLAEDIRCLDERVLRDACEGGHLAVARWLAERRQPSPDEAEDAFLEACRAGQAETAQWAAGLCSRSAATGMSALAAACSAGHAGLACWVVEHFGLTAADVQDGAAVLVDACEAGDLGLVRWLVARFAVPCESFGPALAAACLDGHLPVARWLVEAWFGERECPAPWYGAVASSLQAACRSGELPVARWLVRRFVGNSPDAFDCKALHPVLAGGVRDALREASRHNHFIAVQWLSGCFTFAREDVRAAQVAAPEGFTARWLAELLGSGERESPA